MTERCSFSGRRPASATSSSRRPCFARARPAQRQTDSSFERKRAEISASVTERQPTASLRRTPAASPFSSAGPSAERPAALPSERQTLRIGQRQRVLVPRREGVVRARRRVAALRSSVDQLLKKRPCERAVHGQTAGACRRGRDDKSVHGELDQPLAVPPSRASSRGAARWRPGPPGARRFVFPRRDLGDRFPERRARPAVAVGPQQDRRGDETPGTPGRAPRPRDGTPP